jgi:hypothetical protein
VASASGDFCKSAIRKGGDLIPPAKKKASRKQSEEQPKEEAKQPEQQEQPKEEAKQQEQPKEQTEQERFDQEQQEAQANDSSQEPESLMEPYEPKHPTLQTADFDQHAAEDQRQAELAEERQEHNERTGDASL